MPYTSFFAATAQVIPVFSLAALLEYKALSGLAPSDRRWRSRFVRAGMYFGMFATIILSFFAEGVSLAFLLYFDSDPVGAVSLKDSESMQTAVAVALGGVLAMAGLVGVMTLVGISGLIRQRAAGAQKQPSFDVVVRQRRNTLEAARPPGRIPASQLRGVVGPQGRRHGRRRRGTP